MTQGIMRAQRQSAWVGDADIFVAGHIHSQWSTWVERLRLSEKGIEEGTPAYEQFVNAARWALDEIDPLNLAPYAFTRPLTYVDPKTGASLTAKPKKLRA